ncbi:MAG: hypothetical protein CO042_00360 [Parcubacteria group bacterium CG_4_9_14_0_2_um_filter_41_8]|nr:MAG: hypothetical protein COW93_03150 [Parcubacteria group bacterium CG22_combo_CG10-13_8_21_14_all_41_9]PJC41079.1 MAG: hypothetical protein CO042_00360 [Parcubacteria group bacterium CG_4_9_14_0_2_um_filter_41_8]
MEKIMNNLNSKKNVNYDAKSDVLYFGIKKGVEEEYAEVAPGVNVELDKEGNVIGVEVLNASKMLKPVAKIMQAVA